MKVWIELQAKIRVLSEADGDATFACQNALVVELS